MEYHSPTELESALSLLARQDMSVIAGGTDLYPNGGLTPARRSILDVTGISVLRGISRHKDGYRFGACARWSEIGAADLPPSFAGLQDAARAVGSLQIQNAGSIAGNLCNASPAADGVPPLLALEAQVELAGPKGHRRLDLADFILGPGETALAPAELLVAVHVPAPPGHAVGVFHKLGSRKYLVISISMVSVVLGCDASGRIDFARIAAGACSPVARRLSTLETDVIGQFPAEVRLQARHFAALQPISDLRADAAYRQAGVAEQVLRAIRAAGEKAGERADG